MLRANRKKNTRMHNGRKPGKFVKMQVVVIAFTDQKPSKYKPHNGSKEKARRLKHAQKSRSKAA